MLLRVSARCCLECCCKHWCEREPRQLTAHLPGRPAGSSTQAAPSSCVPAARNAQGWGGCHHQCRGCQAGRAAGKRVGQVLGHACGQNGTQPGHVRLCGSPLLQPHFALHAVKSCKSILPPASPPTPLSPCTEPHVVLARLPWHKLWGTALRGGADQEPKAKTRLSKCCPTAFKKRRVCKRHSLSSSSRGHAQTMQEHKNPPGAPSWVHRLDMQRHRQAHSYNLLQHEQAAPSMGTTAPVLTPSLATAAPKSPAWEPGSLLGAGRPGGMVRDPPGGLAHWLKVSRGGWGRSSPTAWPERPELTPAVAVWGLDPGIWPLMPQCSRLL